MTFLIFSLSLECNLSLGQVKYEMEDGSIFREVTEEAGITYQGTSFGHAWSDINLDGYPDLVSTGHGRARLYINQKDGTFKETDIPYYKILDTIDGEVYPYRFFDMHAPTFVDINDDGYPDLYIPLGGDMGRSEGKENLLFLNDNGRLVFENKAAEYLIQDSLGRGRQAVFFDYNEDGYLDFLNCNFDRGDNLYNSSLYTFHEETGQYRRNQDFGLGNVTSLRSASIMQSRNKDTGYLVNIGVLNTIDVYDYSEYPFKKVFNKTHFGLRDNAIADFNGDGYQDIFSVARSYSSEAVLVNDTTLKTYLYAGSNKIGYNDENKVTFETDGIITIESKVYPYKGSVTKYWRIGKSAYAPDTEIFSLSSENSKNQGFAPLCLLCLGVNIGYNVKQNMWEVFNSDPIDNLGAAVTITSTKPIKNLRTVNFNNDGVNMPDRMYLSTGKANVFQADSDFLKNAPNISAGVSVVAADFDNDMDVDIIISNQGGAVNYPNLYYENDGRGKFTRVENFGAESTIGGRGGSISVVDYDNDGFLDLFIENGEGVLGEGAVPLSFNDGPDRLYKNKGNENHWIKFQLTDKEGTGNKLAIGTTVHCYTGGVKQVRLKGGETHAFAQNDPTVHFGLGKNIQIDSVEIIWPDKKMQTYYELSADSMYYIDKSGTPNERPNRPALKFDCKVFPNPASDFIRISNVFYSHATEVSVYDFLGKLVRFENYGTPEIVPAISTADLPNGIYTVKILYENKEECISKFQVHR